MIREFRLALYFVVGLMLGGWSVFSYAETIPATAGGANVAGTNWYKDWNTVKHASIASACTASCSQQAAYAQSIGQPQSACVAYTSGSCLGTNAAGTTNVNYMTPPSGTDCPDGYTYNGSVCVAPAYVCPTGQNWTLSGSTCTRPDCAAPQVIDAATGVCSAPPCALAANAQIGTGRYATAYPAASGAYCVNGCSAYAAGNGTIQGSIKYQYMYVNGAGGAASSCTPGGSTPSASPSDPTTSLPLVDPAVQKCIDSGQGFGQINGVTVCSGPTTTTATKTGTTTNTPPAGGGSPSTTGVTSNTTCTGDGACTTTTTTTTTSGGSGPGGTGPGSTTTTGEVKKEETKAGFCEENPDASMCSDVCEEQPDLLQCLKLGEPGEEPAIKEENKSVSSVTPFASGSGSCPASVSLPRGAEFSYAPMCNFASGVRPIVLAIAWLLAGGMIFAWFRS